MTRNPNALWVSVQLHEAWEYGEQPERFLIFDRDTKFSADVVSSVKAMGSQSIRAAFRSPWQNGIAERWVGSVRRDLLDHVMVLNQKHLRQLLNEYIRYYHEDRTHLGLGRTLLMVELRPPRHLTARSYRCGDSAPCTTAIQRRPNKSQLRTNSFVVRVGGDSRVDFGRAFPLVSKTLRPVEGPLREAASV